MKYIYKLLSLKDIKNVQQRFAEAIYVLEERCDRRILSTPFCSPSDVICSESDLNLSGWHPCNKASFAILIFYSSG